MKKYYLIILVLAGLASCSSPNQQEDTLETPVADKTADSLLIVPGQSIGNIKLDDDMQALIKLFGKPDQSDAAMGGAEYIWLANQNAADYSVRVYGHRNMGGPDEGVLHIRKILVTNPDYKTSEGIRAGLPADSIRKKYAPGDSSVYNVDHKPMRFYADIPKGIGFEIDPTTKRCTAISIFAPNDTASARINLY